MPTYDLNYIAMLVCAWGCGVLGIWALLDMIRKIREARERSLSEIVVTDTKSPFMKALLPTARGIGAIIRASFGSGKEKENAQGPNFFDLYHQRIRERLLSAGSPEGINADEYFGFMVIYSLIGAVFGAMLYVFLEIDPPEAFVFAGVLLGSRRMPGWLKRAMVKRHTRIKKELPFSLDLLTLAIEAGLDFTSSLDRICRKLGDSPLGEEFKIMLREIRLGKSRSDAMRDLGRRVGVGEVQSVMTSLVQAEEMGANIGPILRIQADSQRERRSQRAEEAAGKAPVKMVFPLLIFMGVVVLIIFGSLFIKFFL